MFKIDKTTHLAILITFALVFIIIYLYYTINDVRKLQVEVKKLQEDVGGIQKLLTSVGNLKNEQVCAVAPSQKVQKAQQPIPQPVNIDIKEIPVTVAQAKDSEVFDDASSVNTDEIRDILDVEEKEHQVHPVGPTQVPQGMQDAQDVLDMQGTKDIENTQDMQDMQETTHEQDLEEWPTPEVVATMKYDELRDFCKKHGLSTKGTRDVLIARINDTNR